MNKTWFLVTFILLMVMNYAAFAVLNVSFNIAQWGEESRVLHVLLYPFCCLFAFIIGGFKDQMDSIPR